MEYHTRTIRPATAREAERLSLEPDGLVVATERSITADGEVVAFSYDAVRRDALPASFDPEVIEGSLFRVLEGYGQLPASTLTELHASRDPNIGWRRRPAEPLYLALDQIHYLADATPVAYSQTYFHEGRFQFSLVRTV